MAPWTAVDWFPTGHIKGKPNMRYIQKMQRYSLLFMIVVFTPLNIYLIDFPALFGSLGNEYLNAGYGTIVGATHQWTTTNQYYLVAGQLSVLVLLVGSIGAFQWLVLTITEGLALAAYKILVKRHKVLEKYDEELDKSVITIASFINPSATPFKAVMRTVLVKLVFAIASPIVITLWAIKRLAIGTDIVLEPIV